MRAHLSANILMTANNLKHNCLPTQLSQPQWWEEGKLSLLPLRKTEPAAKQPRFRWAWRAWNSDWKGQLLLLACLAILSVAGYYVVSRFVATTVIVQGRSMTPTLQ